MPMSSTRFWIDETYIDYVDPNGSLEPFAAESKNVVICKSMSKAYALSGVRAAYLCAPKPIAQDLLSVTPPWAVSLPAQLAAVTA
ncbi:MAG: aminotransferase class I/II-fold pyridoxal phosphate-dependent enzyme [Pirellulales bacterium]|nr:aminotransferase class I/II-fold pyridoxal phosphate-dependent enzyme [Pirellulales bacterium]